MFSWVPTFGTEHVARLLLTLLNVTQTCCAPCLLKYNLFVCMCILLQCLVSAISSFAVAAGFWRNPQNTNQFCIHF